MSITKSDEELLFPRIASGKHPYAVDVIKYAEANGIGVSEIAEITGKSQPYISQVKAGNGNLKVEDLQPLVHKLSPKVPGEEFHTYKVLKEIRPIWPDNWEQAILIKELLRVSEDEPGGRYPSGEASFEKVEKNHNDALDNVDEFGNSLKSSFLGPFQNYSLTNRQYVAQLSEALAQYRTEKAAIEKRRIEGDEFIHQLISQLTHAISLSLIQEPVDKGLQTDKFEELLTDIVKERFRFPKHIHDSLIRECAKASEYALYFPPIVQAKIDYNWVKIDKDQIVNDPEGHAERILSQCRELQNKFDKERLEKERKFRLTGHYSKKSLGQLQSISFSSPDEKEYVQRWGVQLFGNTQIKVFADPDRFYKINLTNAFSRWATDMEFTYLEENVQIGGVRLLNKSYGEQQIAVHELHSQDFVVLHTFEDKEEKREFTMLSDRLTVEKLFEHLNNLAVINSWDMGQHLEIDKALQKSLLSRGYRVPGVNSIY